MSRALYSVLALALLTGCPKPASAPAPVGDPPQAEPRNPAERAKGAAKALGTQLKARLKAAIGKDGLAGGISACKIAAPEIAAAVSDAERLQLGRTSFKLRNPANAPPAWAKDQVEAKVAEPSFSESEDGATRALLPIKLEPLCVGCHGPADGLPADVKAALAKDYPDDQATGFQAGDLRGYFWVVVPPPMR